jgi:hypothetical protein
MASIPSLSHVSLQCIKKRIILSYYVIKIKQFQILEKMDRIERFGTLHADKLHDY